MRPFREPRDWASHDGMMGQNSRRTPASLLASLLPTLVENLAPLLFLSSIIYPSDTQRAGPANQACPWSGTRSCRTPGRSRTCLSAFFAPPPLDSNLPVG